MVEIQYLHTTISKEQLQEFGQLVEDTIRRIESAQFLPHSGIRFPQNPCSTCPTWDSALERKSWSTPLWCGGLELKALVGLTSLLASIDKCYVGTAQDANPAAQCPILRSTTMNFVATPATILSGT